MFDFLQPIYEFLEAAGIPTSPLWLIGYAVGILVLAILVRIVLETVFPSILIKTPAQQAKHDIKMAKMRAELDEYARKQKIGEEYVRARKAAREATRISPIEGTISPQILCPHCQTRGHVSVERTTTTDKTRLNSVVGAALDIGVNTQKDVTKFFCDNCKIDWEVPR